MTCVLAFVLSICLLSLVIIKASIIPSRSAPSLEVQIQQPPAFVGSIKTVTNANDSSRTSGRVLNNDETPACTICGKLGVPFFPNVRLDWINASCAEADSYYSQVATSLNDTVCHVTAQFEAHCCDHSALPPRYECEDTVKSNLLQNYNTRTAPIHGASRTLDIDTYMTHWYVEHVDVTASTVQLLIEIELIWKDPRLAWDASDPSSCVSVIDMYASHDPEQTDIWVPDFDLKNKAVGLQDFSARTARVYSDGTVYWDRTGSIKALCTFVGLKRMPYDNLGCQLHFGGNLLDEGIIRYNMMEREKARGFGAAEYQQSYTEFYMLPDKSSCDYYVYQYGHSTNFHCELFFHRAANHYVLFIILPNIIFTTMSFGQFYLDFEGGERLSYAVTILLILVAQSLVASSLLPVCQENLWINTFNFSSMVFTMVALLETIIGFWLLARTAKKSYYGDSGEKVSLAKSSSREQTSTNPRHDTVFQETSNGDVGDVEVYQPCSGIEDVVPGDDIVLSKSRELNNVIKQNWYQLKSRPQSQSEMKDKLRCLDRLFLVVVPMSYFLFLIIMFASNHSWEDPKIPSEPGKFAAWQY